jgi:uncharacterized membrane protein (DUF4010 family)
VGYVATRALGPERGTAITGLSGGLVSSTAVTLTFAKRSREEGGRSDDALAAGSVLAWAVSFVRVVVLAAVVYPPLASAIVGPLGAMVAVTAVAAFWSLRRAGKTAPSTGPAVVLRNPFSLLAAAKFGLLFAVVLVLVTLVQQHFPGGGTYVVAALAGSSDVDAITLSMSTLARNGEAAVAVAAGSIVVAVLANTLVKCALSATLGGSRLRRSALLLTFLLVAIGLAALAVL